MCIITILHCTPCELREDMPEEGLIITKDWHAQLLVNLDCEGIPFKRCVNAINSALSNGRSDTMYLRCRNVEVKHMAVEKDICYRCSTRRRIQSLIAVRKLYEEQTAAWRNEERRDTEAAKDLRKSIRESSRSIPKSGTKILSGATAASLTARREFIISKMESWESCLERQILQRELANAKEADKQAILADEAETKEKRKQERLASVQQRLSRLNRLQRAPVLEENTEQAFGNEQSPRPSSLQDIPTSPKRPSPAMPLIVSSDMTSPSRFKTRSRTIGVASAIKNHSFGDRIAVGADTASAASSASVQGFSTLRAEASEFASLGGLPSSLKTGSLRAQAPVFTPLRHAPPTEPQMMRAPTAP